MLESRELLAADLIPFGDFVPPNDMDSPIVIRTAAEPFGTSASSITSADTVLIDLGYLNAGTTATGSTYRISIQLDANAPISSGDSGPSNPGSGIIFSSLNLFGALPAGVHTLTSTVDTLDQVAESNETNNVFIRQFMIGTVDFGDAPTAAQSVLGSSYPTTLADNGARHTILAGFSLGAAVDAELNGQPNLAANLDDSNNAPDDEDGVTFNGTLEPGAAVSVDVVVTNTAGVANPYLDLWIDFNQDGDWDDAGEQIHSATAAAGTNTINFTVPAGAVVGDTYARVRLHNGITGLPVDGPANDGEVEDQLLVIVPPTGVWQEHGPAPTQNAQVQNVSPLNQVTGAIHTVLAHPTDVNTLYIGAVNGGIWKTTNATAENPTWTPQSDFLGSLSIGAMAFDRTDATNNTLVAGTARYTSFGGEGGARGLVFRTTDGGSTWTQLASSGLTVFGENISGIAARGNTIVVTSSGGFGGVFRSTDGGATFTAISDADFLSPNDNFTDLVEDPSDVTGMRLYAAAESTGGTSTSGGIYRSDDFGATWTKITGPTINAGMHDVLAASNNIEMAVHPTTGRLYAAVLIASQPQGIFHTNDATAASPTWTEMDIPVLPLTGGVALTGATNATPIVIASAAHGLSSGDFVVINGVTGNTAANGFFQITRIDNNNFSLDGSVGNGAYSGGGTWTQVTGPSPSAKTIDESGAQGRIHFSIAVDPSDEDIVYVGGDRQEHPSPIGDVSFNGAIFRGDASIAPDPTVAPSPQWDHMTHDQVALDPPGGTASGSAPHADSREMVIDANGDLVEVDDGGIFKRTSPLDNSGDWFSLAGTLAVIEFHDVAYDSNTDVIIGGTQDNATHYQQTPGGLVWDRLGSGDGGDVVVDNVSLAGGNQSIRYYSSQNLGSFRRSVWDQNNNLVSLTAPALTLSGGGTPLVGNAQFKTPVALNAADPNRLLFIGDDSIYESSNQGSTVVEIGPGLGPTFGFLQDAVAYGTAGNVNALYVGVDDDVLIRTAGAGAPVASATYPGAGSLDQVEDVVMDSSDFNTAFVVDSNQVFTTTNAGTSWADITGNLMSIAGDALYTVAFVPGPTDAVLVGGSLGVFKSLVSALGTWTEVGVGLPNTLVYDLIYDAVDDVLVAGMLGRGAWTLPSFAANVANTPPTITSNGGGPTAATSIDENTSAVTDVNASDPEGETENGGGLTYSLSGPDAALFTIDAAGSLDFLAAPDFENPGDVGGNNVYDVTVIVTDSGSLTDSQDIAVTVTDLNEGGSPVVVVDNGDPEFAIAGSWVLAATPSSPGYQTDIHYSNLGNGGDQATWTFSGLTPGIYEVSVTWSAQSNRASNAPYSIFDNATPVAGPFSVDQTVAPVADHVEGSTNFQIIASSVKISSTSLEVLLTDLASNYVIADAVRIERTGDLPSGPEIVVRENATNIDDGSGVLNFGTTPVGTVVNKTLTVENTGDADLTLTQITQGDLPSGYTLVSGFGDTVLSPSETTNFELRLDAGSEAAFGGPLSIANDDADENPFNFTLTGSATSAVPVVIDNGDVGFATIGSWSFVGNPSTPGYQTDIHHSTAGSGADVATWTFNGLTPGEYEVAVTWTALTNRASNAPFSIFDNTTVVAGPIAVDQTVAPLSDRVEGATNFQIISSVNINSDTLAVEMTDLAKGYVIADAVRIWRKTVNTGSEIVVRDGATNIADGSGVVDFGGTLVGSPISKTLTVENTGTGDLTLTQITQGDLPSGYTLVFAFGDTVLSPGETTTFEIRLDAASAATFSGPVSFANDDSDENPFNFMLTGLVATAVPQIINNGDAAFGTVGSWVFVSNPSPTGYQTDIHHSTGGTGGDQATWTFGGLTAGDYEVAVTWTAKSNRATNAPYTILDNTTPMAGPIAIDQTIAPQADHVEGGTPFQVLSVVTISSDTLVVQLTDQANNYVIADAVRIRQAAVIAGPEIEVRDGASHVADGSGVVNFGSTLEGTPVNKTLTVENLGTSDLTLTQITQGDLPSGYTLVSAFGDTVLSPGETTTFEIRLDAASATTFTGSVAFASDDADENPFNFMLTGTVTTTAPLIIDDGDAGFGTVGEWMFVANPSVPGYQTDLRHSIAGSGSDQATWTFTGLSAGLYEVSVTWSALANRATDAPYTIFDNVTPVAGPIAVDQTASPLSDRVEGGTSFQIIAGSVAISNGTLVVRLTDQANNYVIADAVRIVRIGDLPSGPEILVRDGAMEIADGVGVVDFGSTPVGTSVSKTLTVENLGSADLTLTQITQGDLPSGYTLVAAFGDTVLSPSESTTFEIRLDAGSEATFTDPVSFANDDADENPFNFMLTGTATTALIMDNGDPGFATVGAWVFAQNPLPAAHETDIHYSASGTGLDQATWTFSGLTAGAYEVAVTWNPKNNRATNAPFTILDNTTTVAGPITVNQTVAPLADRVEGTTNFQLIAASVSITSDTLVVQLTDQANNFVIADAVRIKSISPPSQALPPNTVSTNLIHGALVGTAATNLEDPIPSAGAASRAAADRASSPRSVSLSRAHLTASGDTSRPAAKARVFAELGQGQFHSLADPLDAARDFLSSRDKDTEAEAVSLALEDLEALDVDGVG